MTTREIPVSLNTGDKMSDGPAGRWTSCLDIRSGNEQLCDKILIGVLPGEGVGPEIIACALQVLEHVSEATDLQVEIRTGGSIGRDSERLNGQVLSDEVVEFCADVFQAGGAVLSGPGGGRYVYELRQRFDLFFKISPLLISNGPTDAGKMKPEVVRDVDILVTRENTGGIYQGSWNELVNEKKERVAEHRFRYTEAQVRRFLSASARLAARRRGELTVVWKEAGLPSISQLWRDCAAEIARETGIRCSMVDIDLMAYQMIQEPRSFDVIAAPNLFGDILADLGAVLLGSRGLTYSGNYDRYGHAVYQTNHGAAYDLQGANRANPAGQIFSLAMMLRETFGLTREAHAVEQAVREEWREGWCTEDIAGSASGITGTREFGRRIARRAANLMQMPSDQLSERAGSCR